jgi:hypothetical protein
MAQITPNNLAFSAGGVFTTGGSVTFGFENVPGDPDAPATLKGIFTDSDQTISATNPQPLDSDAKYQQSATGVLYGTPPFSILVRNSAGVQVAYNPSYNSNAYEVGTGPNETPLNSDLGSASLADTGTAAGNVPLNSDLGDASQKTVGTATGQLPDSDDLSMVGATENFTSNNLNQNEFGGGSLGRNVFEAYYRSSTEMVAILPLTLIDDPSGITITSGASFAVYNFIGGNLVKSSVVASDILLAGLSRNGVKLIITGFSGLVARDIYEIRINVTGSKITVNY